MARTTSTTTPEAPAAQWTRPQPGRAYVELIRASAPDESSGATLINLSGAGGREGSSSRAARGW
jgi:hypothetical protein